MIDRWFPCPVVDRAVGTPEGSGRSEKAILTWFASRPIAQARAAVLSSLLRDDEAMRSRVEGAILRGDPEDLRQLGAAIRARYPKDRPVVLDPFSGRGIIPLEAARLGLKTIGIDYSPVATLGGRLLADYPLREWSAEPPVPFGRQPLYRFPLEDEPRLISDLRVVLREIGERIRRALDAQYPKNPDGSLPWAYLWSVTIPCDSCARRFPLVGSLVLQHPYKRTKDPGQAYRIVTGGDEWKIEVFEGVPDQLPTLGSLPGKRRKSARCPFCEHPHSLDTVKSKGAAGEYLDVPLLAADIEGRVRKVFRNLRREEIHGAMQVSLHDAPDFGRLSVVPDEEIPPGNEDTIRPTGYGYRSFGQLMNARQTLQFVETVRTIRACRQELLDAGVSGEYSAALAAYAAATLIRRMRCATRGARLRAHGNASGTGQNRVQAGDLFADESKVSFQFDYLETSPGQGPGTWESVAETGLQALAKHMRDLQGIPGRFRQGSALSLPFRDGTIDAIVTDPPYYNMIDYCDASNLFYVWLRRVLFDVIPDLFGEDERPLQDVSEEIIVKRGGASGEHRTKEFYEASLSKAFREARRVLRRDGSLVVVFGHSDPDAWKRLLSALHEAGFVVTSAWPSRTEAASTGVASIKVTVTIGCRVAPGKREVATAAQVDREVREAVKGRVPQWERDGLALADQLMAAYGPAMEVYGRYSRIVQPDNSTAPIERYLMLARTAVRDAVAMKIDAVPLETFDALTRFAIFWMRLFGRTTVPKGEARFLAQADNLRLDDVRDSLLVEDRSGYKLTLDGPDGVYPNSPLFDIVRAMASAWNTGASEAVAQVLLDAERSPDDEHIWAVIGDLTRQLPGSDRDARAFTGIQRNADTIQKTARGLRRERAAEENQLQLGVREAGG